MKSLLLKISISRHMAERFGLDRFVELAEI